MAGSQHTVLKCLVSIGGIVPVQQHLLAVDYVQIGTNEPPMQHVLYCQHANVTTRLQTRLDICRRAHPTMSRGKSWKLKGLLAKPGRTWRCSPGIRYTALLHFHHCDSECRL